MFIPPEKMKVEIESQPYGVWIHTDYEGNTALACKMPTVVIKAVSAGAKVELIIGFTEFNSCHFALAIRVHDSSDAPFLALAPVRTIISINAILSLSTSENFFITFVDEFDNNVCHATFKIMDNFRTQIRAQYAKIVNPCLLTNIDDVNDVLDSFSHHIYPWAYGNKVYEMTSLCLHLEFEKFTNVMYLDFEEHSEINYVIGEGNEGTTLEKQLSHTLTILFKDKVFQSPWKIRDTKENEFVDVLVLADKFNLLISSKAMSLYDTDFSKTQQRRLAGLTSHTKEAFKQLHGSCKSMKRNEVVKTFADKKIIDFDRSLPCHAIAVISEFVPDNNAWTESMDLARTIYDTTGVMTHLLDVPHFIDILKLALNSHDRLDGILRQRFKGFYSHNTFNITSTDSSLPFSVDDL